MGPVRERLPPAAVGLKNGLLPLEVALRCRLVVNATDRERRRETLQIGGVERLNVLASHISGAHGLCFHGSAANPNVCPPRPRVNRVRPRSGGLLRTRGSVLAIWQRAGSALTNRFRTADDLPVNLALVRPFFHASVSGFR
jgi:hypothetical protein